MDGQIDLDVHIYTCIHAYACVCRYVYMHICMRVRVCVCARALVRVYPSYEGKRAATPGEHYAPLAADPAP